MLDNIIKKLKLMNQQKNIDEISKESAAQITHPLSTDYNANLSSIKAVFENCSDIVIREFKIGINQKISAFIIIVDALVNDQLISDNLLKSLIKSEVDINKNNVFLFARESAVFLSEVKDISNLEDAVDTILSGSTVLFIDGCNNALGIEAKSWEHRAISQPETEAVVRGSREGFVETLRTNTSLLRRIMKDPNLKFESMKIGKYTKTEVCIAYLKGVANEEILSEIRSRLGRINNDAILESGYIEAFIEDAPFSIFPTIGNSEKPDKVVAKLLEGRVAVLVDGTPFVLTAPYLMVEAFQSTEDYYSRPYYSSVLRMLRWVAFFISIYLPAVYVALVTYHQLLLPTKFIISISTALEGVPFPAAVEALLMQVVYEILREGGVRLPRPIGQAVSIVGALVIGEASVRAGLIGAPMVIIVALTAVSSFVVPALTDVNFILRMAFLLLAGVSGLYGIMLGSAFIITHICSLRSIGVPYTAPIAPFALSGIKDVFIRTSLWSMFTRPNVLRSQNSIRQRNNKPQPPRDKT